MAGETLVYDVSNNKAFCLNETSSIIWKMCDGNRTITEIADQLSKKLTSRVSEDLVWLAIDQLTKEELLEDDGSGPEAFAGMSRREVFRKAALTSAIALPIVSAMSVPTAAAAQSNCIPVGQSCFGGGTCCPGSFCQNDSFSQQFGLCSPVPI